MTDRVHVHPANDLVEHDTVSDDCVCGPSMRPVRQDDGSITWVITHHSLDGREAKEPQT
jgi:hypothetical protein